MSANADNAPNVSERRQECTCTTDEFGHKLYCPTMWQGSGWILESHDPETGTSTYRRDLG